MTKSELEDTLRWRDKTISELKEELSRCRNDLKREIASAVALQNRVEELEAEREELCEDVRELRKTDLIQCHDTIKLMAWAIRDLRGLWLSARPKPSIREAKYMIREMTRAMAGVAGEEIIASISEDKEEAVREAAQVEPQIDQVKADLDSMRGRGHLHPEEFRFDLRAKDESEDQLPKGNSDGKAD